MCDFGYWASLFFLPKLLFGVLNSVPGLYVFVFFFAACTNVVSISLQVLQEVL